jgi:hypothetical protein
MPWPSCSLIQRIVKKIVFWQNRTWGKYIMFKSQGLQTIRWAWWTFVHESLKRMLKKAWRCKSFEINPWNDPSFHQVWDPENNWCDAAMLLTKCMYTGKKVSDFGTRTVLQAAKMGRGRQMYVKSASILLTWKCYSHSWILPFSV